MRSHGKAGLERGFSVNLKVREGLIFCVAADGI